jgi:hypothetical protein
MFSERDMEDAIVSDPRRFLKIYGLKILSRQHKIGNFIFDLMYEDQGGNKLIVEIQKGVLDRNHAFKIVDYAVKYQNENPTETVSTLVVANKILPGRKQFLDKFDVRHLEIFDEEIINWKKEGSIIKTTVSDIASKFVVPPPAKRLVNADSLRQQLLTKIKNSLNDVYWNRIDYTKNNITAPAGLSGCEWVVVTRKDECRTELAFRNKNMERPITAKWKSKRKISREISVSRYSGISKSTARTST